MTRKLIIPILMMAILASCIKNDIPYPRIQANFQSITAEGEIHEALIDSAQRVVTLYFGEEANIYNVRISDYTLTPKSEIVSTPITNGLDLSSPVYVTLRLYQDYLWTITAQQDIERTLTLGGQIGTSVIDVPGRRVIATVSSKMPLNHIKVESCKLGATTATMTPDINGEYVDFSQPLTVNVENYGHIERWTIYVTQTQSTVTTLRADGWTCVAWVYGQAEAGKKNIVEYRIKGDTEWLTVPDEWITEDGGDFHARITGLSPLTTYEARAVSGSEYGEVLEFVTGAKTPLPDGDFDEWWLDGKVWNPWKQGGTQFWDTGNKGAATLGQSNTTPTDDTVTGTGQAARLETRFVGIGMVGKLAAGNLFAGRYVRTDGTNGVLALGQPFTERPTALKGYLKYKTAPISSVTAGYEALKGRPDTCSVWIALIDSDEPYEIRTNPQNKRLFDPNDPCVVAYGRFESGSDIEAYAPFEVEFEYRATNRQPKYILVTSSASKYGDFFTGGNGALLLIDRYELIYDYE